MGEIEVTVAVVVATLTDWVESVMLLTVMERERVPVVEKELVMHCIWVEVEDTKVQAVPSKKAIVTELPSA